MSNALNSATFINCTLPDSKCTQSDWLFGGVAGVCDAATELCICPAGYTGEDDFDSYNDCHVVLSIRLGARVASLVACALSMSVALVLVVKLFFKWGLLYVPDPEELDLEADMQETGMSTVPGSLPSPGSLKKLPEVEVHFEALKEEEIGEKGSVSSQLSPIIPTDDASNQPKVDLPGPIVGLSLTDRAKVTTSQRFGFLFASGHRDSDQNQEDESSHSAQKPTGGRGSSLNEHNLPTKKSGHALLSSVHQAPNHIPISRLPRASVRAIKDLSPFRSKAYSPTGILLAQEAGRRRRTLLLVILFLGFSLFMVLYLCLQIFGNYSHREGNLAINISLAAIISCVLMGVWILAFIWFGNLPNLATYGQLFRINSILIRRPMLVKELTLINCFMSTVLSIIFFVILPAEYPEQRYNFDTALMIFGSLEVLIYGATFISICWLLIKCFNALLNNQFVNRANKAAAEESVVRARHTVMLGIFFCVILVTPISLVFFLMAVVGVVRTNLWLITPCLVVGGSFANICVMYMVVIRTGSGSSSS